MIEADPEFRHDFSLDRRACGDVLGDDAAPATAHHAVIAAAYGLGVVYGEQALDPALLYAILERDFSVNIPVETENRIRALMHGVESEDFYEDPLVFAAVVDGLNHGDIADVMTGAFSDATAAEMLWAIYEVWVNRDQDDRQPFAADVREIIVAAIREDYENGPLEALGYVMREHAALVEHMLKLGFDEQVVRAALPDPEGVLDAYMSEWLATAGSPFAQ